MPNRFHQIQYEIAGALACACMVGYIFAPAAKSETLASTLAILVGFLIGKFSNGYAKGAKLPEAEDKE